MGLSASEFSKAMVAHERTSSVVLELSGVRSSLLSETDEVPCSAQVSIEI